MIENFKKFIEAQKLLVPNSKTLLAVSGGIDSIVMVDLFYKSGLSFSIVHCNFQLRGAESDGDQEFVENLAKQLNVDFYVEKFDTLIYAESEKVSIQLAARELRYTWFNTFLTTYNQIAVAHHQNDAIETMIYNLTKGTGLAGLRGIKPKNGKIIRPLLFALRNEIEKYASDNQLEWREDSSNVSTKYARNKIRNEVIPLLKQINPSIEKTSLHTFERLGLVENFIQDSVTALSGILYKKYESGLTIEINELNKLSSPLLFLNELVSPFGFSFIETKLIHNSVNQSETKQFFTKDYVLVKERLIIRISKRGDFISMDQEFEINEGDNICSFNDIELKIEELDFNGEIKSLDKNSIWVDKDKLKFPLKLRKWMPGDSFQPFGMKGRKKISDLLIDEKLEISEKNKVWVICSDIEIVWVMGIRMSEGFKIDSNTKRVLSFSLMKIEK